MVAENDKPQPPHWKSQEQTLRKEGHLLKYKLGLEPHIRPWSLKPLPKRSRAILQAHSPPRTQLSQYATVCINPEQEGFDEQTILAAAALDNRQALALTARKNSSPLVQGLIAGLRGDPFDAFPISTNSHVASAFDYFAEVYAPFAVPPSLFRTYMQTLLHDEMYFEQTIAFSIVAQNLRSVQDGHMPKAVMHYTNSAIAHLRQRLLANDRSDIVMLTIMQQAIIQHTAANHRAFGVHARAIQELVALRGGFENLGWDGYIANRARLVLSIAWKDSDVMIVGFWEGKFTYPTHPFPPELSQIVSKFPRGLSDSALRSELSMQFINYLDLTLQWDRDETGKTTLKTSSQYAVLDMPKLSQVERLLATAIQAYTNSIERTEYGRPNDAAEQSVQNQIHVLSAHEHLTKCDRNVLTWVCLMLRATTNERTKSWIWANAWLCSMNVSRREEEELGRLFLPIPTSRVDELWSEDSISLGSQSTS